MLSHVPLVSVITPSFRCADTLSVTLKSLLKQDETRWESIIVDDGSPDASIALAETFAAGDGRFKLLRQPNAGACVARNTGLSVAKGRYVLFLDADDWMEPGALSAMVAACERKHLSAVHGNFRYAKPDGTPTEWYGAYCNSGSLFESLASSNVLSLPSCVLLRRSVLDQIGGGFDPSLAHCGDWDLWARVARTDGRIDCISQCVTGYRMRPASLSRNPLTLLRDATTVLGRIHSRDPRVQSPRRCHAAGMPWLQLPGRLAGFTFYAAALAAMQGRLDAAEAALDTISDWPTLPAARIAEFLLHAACFSKCVAPDDLRPLPPSIRQTMDRLVREMERRTFTHLRDQVNANLAEMGFGEEVEVMRIADRARLQRPRTAGDTLASEVLRSLALRECLAG